MLYIEEDLRVMSLFRGQYAHITRYKCYGCGAVQRSRGLRQKYYCPKCGDELPDVYMLMSSEDHRAYWHRTPEAP